MDSLNDISMDIELTEINFVINQVEENTKKKQ